MGTLGTVKVDCPVCGKPWLVPITGKMTPRYNRPGQAAMTVTAKKPIRVPREHRSCIDKVVA